MEKLELNLCRTDQGVGEGKEEEIESPENLEMLRQRKMVNILWSFVTSGIAKHNLCAYHILVCVLCFVLYMYIKIFEGCRFSGDCCPQSFEFCYHRKRYKWSLIIKSVKILASVSCENSLENYVYSIYLSLPVCLYKLLPLTVFINSVFLLNFKIKKMTQCFYLACNDIL